MQIHEHVPGDELRIEALILAESRAKTRDRLRTVADEAGDRTGFAGRRYRTEHVEGGSYTDRF